MDFLLGPMKQSSDNLWWPNDHSTFSEGEENYKGLRIFSYFRCGININRFKGKIKFNVEGLNQR